MRSRKADQGLHVVKSSSEKFSSPYFRVGEAIPDSGIYRVFHAEHRTSHEVVLLAGEVFPRCSECKDDVHFELLRAVPTISIDPNFIRVYEIPHPDEADEEKSVA